MFTDAEGKAYFERVLQGAVLAEGQGWSSVADWIGPVESPYYLRLVPRTELVVQVLDSEDHGVSEVPVSIGTVADARWLPMIQRGTSAAGMARFDGVERLALRAQKEQALGVYLGFPHLPRVYQLIDPANLTNETITLKLPAYAAMTLEVLDGQGKRIEQPLKAELGLVDGLEESPFQPILARRSTTGLVEFPFVGCGAPLLVRLSGIPELQDQVIELRGPDRNGVPVERAVTWYQRRTIFVGTARDRGQALAGRTIRATWGDGRDNRSLPTTTGPNGEFRIVTTGPEARFLNLEIVAKDGGLPYSANPPIPNPLPGGEYSLDPIQWETLPVFLEGRVVDSAGVPIPGAFVKLESKQKGSAGQ
ncbi:MAG TPA: hypothetical protein P5218_16950, partial [Planctomycetota bacterium]|nr:hypothetical protein [Planctomycetota bacterium]